jgi:hypothetical protein
MKSPVGWTSAALYGMHPPARRRWVSAQAKHFYLMLSIRQNYKRRNGINSILKGQRCIPERLTVVPFDKPRQKFIGLKMDMNAHIESHFASKPDTVLTQVGKDDIALVTDF